MSDFKWFAFMAAMAAMNVPFAMTGHWFNALVSVPAAFVAGMFFSRWYENK